MPKMTDAEALAKLREAVRPTLTTKARRLLLDTIDAEDACGEAEVGTAISLLLEWHDRAHKVLAEIDGGAS